MNALELAEERANNPYLDPEANAEDFKKIAIMLRKQQVEIEELKEMLHIAGLRREER